MREASKKRVSAYVFLTISAIKAEETAVSSLLEAAPSDTDTVTVQGFYYNGSEDVTDTIDVKNPIGSHIGRITKN